MGNSQVYIETQDFRRRPPDFHLEPLEIYWRPQIFFGDIQIFIEDPQIFIGDHNLFISVPYESLGSATKIWGLIEKLGVSNEMVEMADHYPLMLGFYKPETEHYA